MYSVTKEIDFCYGHRLPGHTGKCRHLHGHNATAIIRLESETLDPMGMVCDFGDIGGYVRDWIDEEIDHNMLMSRHDPLLRLLEGAGERVYVMDSNPTAENIARLIYEKVAAAGYPVVEVSLRETGSAEASYRP